MEGLSIIVPAYNEEESLASAVNELTISADKTNVKYEIVIVNDGSKDKTGSIADGLSRRFSKIKVVNHSQNMMIGGAIISGISHSQYDNIIVSPVDSPLDDNQIAGFLKTASKADIVCGYRPGREGYSLLMRILSKIYCIFLSVIFCTRLHDFTWISLYRKRVFDVIKPKFNGIAIFPEILVKSQRKGFRIEQIECVMKPRISGRATVGKPGRVIRLFFETLNLWFSVNFTKW